MPLKDDEQEAISALEGQSEASGQGRVGQLHPPHAAPPTPYARYMQQAGFRLVGRTEGQAPESDFERQVYLVEPGNQQPRDHAWATARFAIDSMAEHAALFTLLLPPEVAGPQREQARLLGRQYRRLVQHIDVQGPPPAGEVRSFTRHMRDELEPILQFKQECQDLQASGELRSLAWPTLFDHTRREAEHWEDRLGRIGGGDIDLEASHTVGFWGHVLDEHARFVAHLLDPAEQQLVRQFLRRSEGFQAAVAAPKPEAELGTVLEMAEEALGFMTETARGIEAARIQGAIAPMLADHWRRETVWAVDELQRLQG